MDNKFIVLEPAANLRTLARAALRGNWQNALAAMAVCLIIIDLVGTLIDAFLGTTYTFAPGIELKTSYAWMYRLALVGAINVGIASFSLRLFRHQDAKIGNIFAGFEQFGKAFVLGLLIEIFIVLWTLLLIVPGIIAYFRYSQAYFLMRDHPEWSAMECIRESKRLMNGNKAKLFTTTLSFIGWWILAMAPALIYSTTVSLAQLTSAALTEAAVLPSMVFGPMDYIVIFVLSLGMAGVQAYYNTTCAAFYEVLTGHMNGKVYSLMQ